MNCSHCNGHILEIQTALTCDQEHAIHYECHMRLCEYTEDAVPCSIAGCDFHYRDTTRQYRELFLIAAKYCMVPYMRDILNNRMKSDVWASMVLKVIEEAYGDALLFMAFNGYVMWNEATYGAKFAYMIEGNLKGSIELVDAMRQCGLNVCGYIFEDCTLAEMAVNEECVEMLQYLNRMGCNFGRVRCGDHTLLEYAQKKKAVECVEYLDSLGVARAQPRARTGQ